jgi:hypothetical protein
MVFSLISTWFCTSQSTPFSQEAAEDGRVEGNP